MGQNIAFLALGQGPGGKLLPVSASSFNGAAVGNAWYVNETTGSDSNPGTAAMPFATLVAAQAAAVANNHDRVFLYGSSHQSAPLIWAKNGVDLIGLSAASENCRSRISVASGLTQTQVTAMTTLVTVTAQNCNFVNIGTFYGFDGVLTPPTSAICWTDSGGRNNYDNCQFQGGGDALTAALAGMRSFLLSGNVGENKFRNCTFGLDTVLRATNANATLECSGGSPRNRFDDCLFEAWVSAAADVHVTVDASGIDRFLMFNNCMFLNAVDVASGVAMSTAFLVNAAAGGSVDLHGCYSRGATVYATTGPIYVDGAVPTGATSSLAVKAT